MNRDQVGAFLSISGLCGVLVQGFLVPRTVPHLIRTDQATLLGLVLAGTQLLMYGIANSLELFFVILITLSPSLMYGPALKALLSEAAGPDQQGTPEQYRNIILYLLWTTHITSIYYNISARGGNFFSGHRPCI
jgi:hypothetical protein